MAGLTHIFGGLGATRSARPVPRTALLLEIPSKVAEAHRWFVLVIGSALRVDDDPANEAPRPNSQSRRPTADQAITVYDGQRLVGSVVERNGEFLAFDVHDRRVGVFTNQSDAMRAIPTARSSS